jgi:membrane dipeptidase
MHMSKDWGISEVAATLHDDAFVWDSTFPFVADCGSLQQHDDTLSRMAKAGYSCVSVTNATDPADLSATVAKLARDRAFFLSNVDRFLLVETAEDLERVKKSGKLGIVFSFQGTTPFGRDLALVEPFYKLGVRHSLMAYNQKNFVGDGCHERTGAGLSRFGVELVGEMNRVGMIVDCSHTAFRTTMDVFETSTAPVVFTHSGVKALWDHDRNINDEQIKACAASGGVIGVYGAGTFFGTHDITPDVMFRHIDYIVNLVGSDYVGLGLDYVSNTSILEKVIRENAERYPAGQYNSTWDCVTPEAMPRLTELMLTRGYPEADIRGILGLNWRRVANAVWK